MKNFSRRRFIGSISMLGLYTLSPIKKLGGQPLPGSVAEAKIADGPYIVDLHCHPTLKNYLLDYHMWKRHRPHKGENYTHMQVDVRHLQQGHVAGILAAHHLPERGMKEQTWVLRKIYPFLRTIAPVFVTRMEDGTPANFRQLTTMMDDFEAHVKKTNEKCGEELLRVAKTFSAFKSGIEAGKIMIAQTIEGSHALGRNLRDEVILDHIDFLAARGICLITLSHFFANDLSFPVEGITPYDKKGLKFNWLYDPSYDDRPLTSQGRKVVRRMLEKGVLVDLTHMTPNGRKDVLDINDEIAASGGRRRPVLFTHGGVRTVVEKYQAPGYENYRFLSADPIEIKRIQGCGGVIGLVFMNFWLTGSDTHTHSGQADDRTFVGRRSANRHRRGGRI